jgi:MFS family permease
MRSWPVVVALGLTQIIGYGTLYYSFSLLAPAMARDFGWSSEWIFGALSAALLIGGLAAPQAGRWMDRYGAGRVMTAGSVVAAAALGACALAPTGLWFVLALVAIEMAANLVQYTAAFALLVEKQARSAARSITHLTLIAGFASTIFWPLTAALHASLTWQQVYLVFAALHLVLCLPLHAWLARPRAAEPDGEAATASAPLEGSLPVPQRRRGFALMVIGFALQSFVNAAVLVHMLPLLAALGLGVVGVIVGSLFGPAQVLSRLANMLFGRGLPQLALAAISAGLLPAAISLLLLTAPLPAGAFAFAIVFGLGSGLSSIAQGTLPLALFGSAGYGARQGQVASVRLIVSSGAPFAFALLMQHSGVTSALTVTAALGAGAILAFGGIVLLLPREAAGRLAVPQQRQG